MKLPWSDAVARCASDNVPFVVATVLATSGSTPRAAGSKMVITHGALFDSIGGGQLENLVAQRSRELLAGASDTREITHFPLAAAALQCCGGSMTVLLESFGVDVMRLCIFGAGHVGQRIALLMQELHCAIELVDTRSDQLECAPAGTRRLLMQEPVDHVSRLDARTHVLVMTHDHQLDYRLMLALLRRTPCASLGLIGSDTKWERFRSRLLDAGIPAERLATVQCPIGCADIPGKEPMAVAIAVSARLLQLRDAHRPPVAATLGWRQIRSSLLPCHHTLPCDETATPGASAVRGALAVR